MEYQFGKPKEHKVVGGDGGQPIMTQHSDTTGLGGDKELSRRLALLKAVVEQPEETPPTRGRPIQFNPTPAAKKSANGRAELETGHELPLGDGIVARLEAADGRGGGEWVVEKNGKQVKRLPGLDIAGVKDWHEAAVLESFYE